MTLLLPFLAVLAAVLLLPGCERPAETAAVPAVSAGPVYGQAAPDARPLLRLAVHPGFNPRRLSQAYQPLIDTLNRRLPAARFELEASRDYAAFEAKLRAGTPELLLPNPWQTLQALDAGYKVVAMAGDADDFRGLLIVRRDSGLQTPADLRGKAVAYPASTAMAACMLPQWFLHQHGVDVVREIDNRYVGSQESSILSVLHGQVAAAATWPPPWRAFQKDHPQEAAELKLMWQTPALVNNAVMVRQDLPPDLVQPLLSLLLSMHETPAGRAVLAAMETARFHPADDGHYAAVRDFITRFEQTVRPVGVPDAPGVPGRP